MPYSLNIGPSGVLTWKAFSNTVKSAPGPSQISGRSKRSVIDAAVAERDHVE